MSDQIGQHLDDLRDSEDSDEIHGHALRCLDASAMLLHLHSLQTQGCLTVVDLPHRQGHLHMAVSLAPVSYWQIGSILAVSSKDTFRPSTASRCESISGVRFL
jgi:hypothetical protein